jgi:hypothetical protein
VVEEQAGLLLLLRLGPGACGGWWWLGGCQVVDWAVFHGIHLEVCVDDRRTPAKGPGLSMPGGIRAAGDRGCGLRLAGLGRYPHLRAAQAGPLW